MSTEDDSTARQTINAAKPSRRVRNVVSREGGSEPPEPVSWLWDGWLARGKVHLLAGAPGTGKTTAALSMAATLSAGGRWPDGTQAEPGNVWVWTGEDGITDTVEPRIRACGGNLTRFRYLEGMSYRDRVRTFDPAKDIPDLSDHWAGLDPAKAPALLIVDPVVSAVNGDSHQNATVRRALQPLVDLARAHACAVLGISHFTKGTANRDPVERVTGSVAFAALARVVMAAAKMPDGGRLLIRAKSNLGEDDGGFRFRLESCDLAPDFPQVRTMRVAWGDAMTGTARELMGLCELPEGEDPGAMQEAIGFLRALLADGPVLQKAIEAEADECGLAWITVRRARAALKVTSKRVGFGPSAKWFWVPPHEGAEQPVSP